jgi:hypothetical protein
MRMHSHEVTDHVIWRLGDDLVVRLPRVQWASGQAELEATLLPRLAPNFRYRYPSLSPSASRTSATRTGGQCSVGSQVKGAARSVRRPRAVRSRSRRRRAQAPLSAQRMRSGCLQPSHTYPLIVERSLHKLAVLGVMPLTPG